MTQPVLPGRGQPPLLAEFVIISPGADPTLFSPSLYPTYIKSPTSLSGDSITRRPTTPKPALLPSSFHLMAAQPGRVLRRSFINRQPRTAKPFHWDADSKRIRSESLLLTITTRPGESVEKELALVKSSSLQSLPQGQTQEFSCAHW